MVIITSSTGDGEPPSNASKFWRKIRREKSPQFLSHMKYTVLGTKNISSDYCIIYFYSGLGDTNYSNFCNCGRVLDRRLKNLVLLDSILQHGQTMLLGIFIFYYFLFYYFNNIRLDLTIEPWLQGLWPALKDTLTKIGNSTETSINNLSESINQLNLTTEHKPTVDRQISSSNKLKSNEDNITYSSNLAELTALTLPPKPVHSLSINLIESAEVILSFYKKNDKSSFILFQGPKSTAI